MTAAWHTGFTVHHEITMYKTAKSNRPQKIFPWSNVPITVIEARAQGELYIWLTVSAKTSGSWVDDARVPANDKIFENLNLPARNMFLSSAAWLHGERCWGTRDYKSMNKLAVLRGNGAPLRRVCHPEARGLPLVINHLLLSATAQWPRGIVFTCIACSSSPLARPRPVSRPMLCTWLPINRLLLLSLVHCSNIRDFFRNRNLKAWIFFHLPSALPDRAVVCGEPVAVSTGEESATLGEP